MVKLHYTYRGAPITPYRPQGNKGPGKVATVLILLVLVSGLLYGAWKLYTSMTSETKQDYAALKPLPQKKSAPANINNSSVVALSTAELPKEIVAFDQEITQLVNSGKLEDARAKLQNYFEKYSNKHSYYPHAQRKLALCTEKMNRSGKLKKYTIYSVQNGDYLSKIANKHGVTSRAIIRETNLTNPDRLKIGQQLRIPAKWSGVIIKNKKSLFLYQANKLIGVFSLSNVPKDNLKFVFNQKNRTFWKSCGLSDNDWNTLKSLIPENSNTQISCR